MTFTRPVAGLILWPPHAWRVAERSRTRQRHLQEEDLPPLANYRVVSKPLLSATALASWLYCRTKPFVQRVLERLGIDLSTPAMRAGAAAHADVQGALDAVAPPSELSFPEALQRGLFLFGSELHFLDRKRRLHGYVDLVFAREGRLHILELKNTRPPRFTDPLWGAPVWPEHGMQLNAYGVLGRNLFGVTPRLRLSYLQGGSKEAVLEEVAASRNPESALLRLESLSVTVPHADRERGLVLEAAREFRRAERQLEIPLPDHTDPRRCARCYVREWCPRRLDRPGAFVPLEAKLLDATM